MVFKLLMVFLSLLVGGCNGQATSSVNNSKESVMQVDTTSKKPKKTRRGILQSDENRLETFRNRPVPELGTQTSLTEEDFQKLLTREEYHILRKEGTERAFTGEYNDHKGDGTYHCRACNAPLYGSSTKFDSRTGWPSFWAAIEGRVTTKEDNSLGMSRTEILCAHCSSHLGHVFTDGPEPTGLRHCANSLSLVFHPARP